MLLRVLIVEDEKIIRLGLVNTIDWLGMRCSVVGSAGDGVSGLRMIEELKPDVVITDIRMPGMDGLQMIAEGRKSCEFKIVLLTSYADFDYAQQAVGVRAYAYLLKPLDEKKLREVIAQIYGDVEQERERGASEAHRNAQAIGEEQPVTTKDPLVAAALDKIEHSSHEKLSVEGIARELFVSPSYLSRRFKAVTGQTFLDMLNRRRVREAVRLLGEGETSISRVAELTGFSDYKHFCAVFKRYTALTPRDYLRGLNGRAPASAATGMK